MKKLTTLFAVLAIAFAASVANADTLNVPGSGMFAPGPPAQINFDFPNDIVSINSVTVNLAYPDNSTGGQLPLVLIAGPVGSQFRMVADLQGALDGGTYNFVLSGGGSPLTGMAPLSSAGTYDFVSTNLASTSAFGWNIQFQGQAAGSSYSDISIDFTPVPEPSSGLIMLGVAGLAIVRRRR